MKGSSTIKNASWIIVCRIVQSLFGLVITMLTTRYLGPSNYGLISYAASITSFMIPVMQLGLRNTLVQEIVNDPESEGTILGTSLVMNLISAVFCIIGIFTFTLIANRGETTTIIVCLLYSTNLIFQALEMIQYWFQAKLLSKYQAVTSLISYVIVSAYKTYLLITGKDIYWFAISYAIDYMLISFALIALYRKLGGGKFRFSHSTAKQLFSKSHYFIVSSLMVTIFAQTDRIMLKLMIDNVATGLYSAAVSCAGMTSFVFSAIIDSARPGIFESKQVSDHLFEIRLKVLYGTVIYLSLAQSAVFTIFARQIILIIYGYDYLGAVSALQFVVWYTTFSYLGSVRNIWILAEGQQKYLWIVNLSGASLNVLLNYVLIPYHGIMGASFASLVTQIFTNVIIGFIIRPIRENNRIMIQSLNPMPTLSFMLERKKGTK